MPESDAKNVATHASEETIDRDPFEVSIERILPGGLGLTHAQGRTVMVALAAPGDRLRVRTEREKGGVAFASIVEVLEPSLVRVEPPCPYFGRCGGCDFQQLNYQAQLEAKAAMIRDCLHRIAQLESIPDFDVVAAPNEWRYRARAQWQYDSVRQRLGYFEANSHRVCDVAECAVLVPELQQQLELLRDRMKQGDLPDDARYFRAIAGDEAVSVGSSVKRPAGRDAGSREVFRTIDGARYVLNAQSFFQTNVELLPQLIDYALGDVNGENAIELYCGVGLFTVPLAHRFERVTAIEDDADATKFARANLAAAGLRNTQVANEDVANWIENGKRHQDAALEKVDFLLLDPPRTGAESRVISGIVRLKPKRICYVSCDPATLARDLKKLIAGGYALDSVAAFDMFPQTHHIETVANLTGAA